ncbi:tetratricopeptide repeat protein [uncultured Fibrobacter sp.]|uniref:tetratricopeptide repeat protein n=1 Tax=uncultured Fibrobacter sp. TaxID=261512 RepID=UPI002620003F|nr:tetratricopeptide repeat protein [uncultured Fibrobacter sp.]
MKCLAILYENFNHFDEAIFWKKNRLELYRQSPNKNDLKTVIALNSIAWSYFLKGDSQEGLVYAKEMKDKIENNPNIGKKDSIDYLDTLALLYATTNQLDKAYELAKNLLNDTELLYGTNQKFLASRYYALAFVLNKMNRKSEALPLAQKAYDTRMQYLGAFNEATKRAETLLKELQS